MTQFLPPNLLALFAAREPIPYKLPVDKLLVERKRAKMSGIAEFVNLFEDPKDTPEKAKVETKEERKDRRRREKAELQAFKVEQGIAMWNPASNASVTTDPYKTLFVGRINFETSESKLRREFESHGSIRKVILVQTKDGKPRGYAFIEFEKERDMHAAYKHADGKKIDGRRVLVDVERGRAVKGWLPRRLGGGLGNTRRAKQQSNGGADGGDRDERRLSREASSGASDRQRRRSRSPRDRASDRDHRASPVDKQSSSRDKPSSGRSSEQQRDRNGDRHHHHSRSSDRNKTSGDGGSSRPPRNDD